MIPNPAVYPRHLHFRPSLTRLAPVHVIQTRWRRLALVTLTFAASLCFYWGRVESADILAAAPSNLIIALSGSNQLLQFYATSPGTVIRATPVTGLREGERLVGIDIRPATGQLYAMGVSGVTGRMYTIDIQNGAATQIGNGFSLPQAAGATLGVDYGFDFNPTVDRIRVISDSRDNFRLHPDTGAVAGADQNLSPGAVVVGAAYDRNFRGAKLTTLYAIDANTDQLVTIGGVDSAPSPNGGVVRPVGALGVNTTNEVGFDIANDVAGSAYASLNVGGKSGFYTINLRTGAATLVGTIGERGVIKDICAAPVGPAQSQAQPRAQ
jgi:hypothetical protein